MLAGGAPRFPVNIPTVNAESMAVIGPFIDAAAVAARVARQLASGSLQKVRIQYSGEIANHDTKPLKLSVLVGLLDSISDEKVSAVNAPARAEAHGIRIEEETAAAEEPYANLVTVTVGTDRGEERVAATNTGEGARVVARNLLNAVSTLGIPHARSDVAPHVTMSAGVASYEAHKGINPAELMSRADGALYQAKERGRNRFEIGRAHV